MQTSTPIYHHSRFLHLFEHPDRNGAYCVFHALTQRKLYGGEILHDIFNTCAADVNIPAIKSKLYKTCRRETVDRIFSDLVDGGFLVTESQEDVETYVRLYHSAAHLYDIRHAYFIPVADCNLRCRYCFVEDETKTAMPTGRMSLETAKKSLEVFARLTAGQKEKISLTFYGGEPLLNKTVLCESMRYVRALEKEGRFDKSVEMSLLTNGVLIDDMVVQAVIDTSTMVSVSIDGPKHLHDATRPDTARTGSFDRALAGYQRLQQAGLQPGVSCTLSRYNIDAIEEVTDYIIKELRPQGMGFNILLPTCQAGNPLDVDFEFAARQLIKAFKILRTHGVYEDRVMRRVSPFIEPYFHFKDCMGVGGQIVISPEGRIGPCQAFLGMDDYFPLTVADLHDKLPDIDSETIYSDPLFEEWRYRFPLNFAKCADCAAIAVCGGGCPYASQMNHGSIWEIDDRICHQAKLIQEWMIWDAYDHMVQDSKVA